MISPWLNIVAIQGVGLSCHHNSWQIPTIGVLHSDKDIFIYFVDGMNLRQALSVIPKKRNQPANLQ
jgi:hypothetical protein